MTFVQSRKFSEQWERLGLTDEELQTLEILIMSDPAVGAVVKGTGGLRKLRFSSPRMQKGRRGGLRVCYVHFAEYSIVHLLVIYEKSERDDLSPDSKKAISKLIQEIESSLEQR